MGRGHKGYVEHILYQNCFDCLPSTGESKKLTSADIAVLQQMKSTIDDQRDVIRSKSAEVNSVKSDLEAVWYEFLLFSIVSYLMLKRMNLKLEFISF